MPSPKFPTDYKPPKGAGYGGPAKGAGVGGGLRPPFEAGNKAALGHGPWDRAKMQSKQEKSEALQQNLYEMAFASERDSDRISATVALLNRIDGLPVARNVNVEVADPKHLTDEQLAAVVSAALGDGDEDAVN